MSRLRPFFPYLGSKWRRAPLYPAPLHNTIREPFAGSAGYSVYYASLNVELSDADPIVCAVWDYLIHATPSEILSLPVRIRHIDEVRAPQEARWLIGYWLNRLHTRPSHQGSTWNRSARFPNAFWGESVRARLSSQVAHIRHWRIRNISFQQHLNDEATWFIDPPYQQNGRRYYRYHVSDYSLLCLYTESRLGQTIALEMQGADWLPFRPFRVKPMRSGNISYWEAIWTKNCLMPAGSCWC